ncbi:MAG: helix-turn-helix transcriptional regulator, partial [Chitinophagaceae bacterium]|nr:helix-turn-helix transcriptional regulator [Chitinophagaceae bacterium]
MPVSYTCPITGEELLMKPGLPDNYNGSVYNGTTTSYAVAGFGFLVIQEIITLMCSFRLVYIYHQRSSGVLCNYRHRTDVLFMRMALGTPVYDITKGSGIAELDREQFTMYSGKNWTTLIDAAEEGVTQFIEVTWSGDFAKRRLLRHNEIFGSLGKSCESVADVIIGPPYLVTPAVYELICKLDFSCTAPGVYLNEQMKELLTHATEEIVFDSWYRKGIKKDERNKIFEAKKIIDANLDEKHTARSLGRKVGLNEYDIKYGFLDIIGYGIDKYRRYRLCIRERNNIILYNKELKNAYKDAGYNRLSYMIDGFRLRIACRPGELRRKKWNLDIRERTPVRRLVAAVVNLFSWL